MTEAKTNITLSGWAGVGTSTLTLLLALTLERKFYPVTQVFRDLDNYFNTDDKKVLSREFEETYQPTVGKLVDMYIDHILLHKSGIVLESDIAAFRLGLNDKIFSIFIKADGQARNARRIADGRVGLETELAERDQLLQAEYKKLWGIDMFDLEQIRSKHNFVMDNSQLTEAQELEQLLNAFKSDARMQNEVDWSNINTKTDYALHVYEKYGKDGLRAELTERGMKVESRAMIAEMSQLFADQIKTFPAELQEFFQ